tara:strand:- start:776 stop:1339 length:564 start_codon:yes stop_codon:yes gene_type:complete
MWQYNGITIRAGKSWTDSSGVKHPSNWMNWSDVEKRSAGMTEVADPQPYDNRFYYGRDGNGNLIAKSLVDVNATDADGNNILDEEGNQVVIDGLKTVYKKTTKLTANSLLTPTDWYVVRKAEDSTTTIPSNVTTFRAAVRTKSGQIEAAIDGASDIAAFVALFDTPVDSNGNPTGKPPISDWPDAID